MIMTIIIIIKISSNWRILFKPIHFLCLCSHLSEVGHIASLPPSHSVSLHSKGTPGFMASDRKSIERTVCNPTITLSPNQETVIQSLSLYLNKTGFQRQRAHLFKQITASLGRKHLRKQFLFLLPSFAAFFFLNLS